MTLIPNPANKLAVASANFATGVSQRCGAYGVGFGELVQGAEGEETYTTTQIIWDLTSRTIVRETTDGQEWNDASLADINSVITGNATWKCVDSSGTLWGFDDGDAEVYEAVLLSLPLGQTAPISHGGWLLAEGETNTPNGANAFSTPLGDVVVWNGTLYTGAGVIVRYYHDGVITPLISGNVTGVAMDLATTSIIQDPWGDLWAVGTARGPEPKTALTFWRFFACGQSPISGDIHTVTGLPSNPSEIGLARAVFDLQGDLVCNWVSSVDSTWESQAQFFRVDTNTWTHEVFSVEANEVQGTKTSLAVQNPPSLPATYLLFEIIIGVYEDTVYGLLDLVTTETQFFPDWWGDWDLGDVYGYILTYDEQCSALIGEFPDTGETTWLPFGQPATNGILDADVSVQATINGVAITQYAPIIVVPYLRGKSHDRLFATVHATLNANFASKISALTFDPPPPPPRAIDALTRENKPKAGRMAKVIDVRKAGGNLVVLGKALVMPSSATDGPVQPLDGSIRFNPDVNLLQIYHDTTWNTIPIVTVTPAPSMNTGRILGRSTSTGQPQEVVVGDGLVLANGVLSSALKEESFYCNRATRQGKPTSGLIVQMGTVAKDMAISATNSAAIALSAATGAVRVTIMKQTGTGIPTVVGYFDWAVGATRATVTLVAPALSANDVLWVVHPSTVDTTLANIAYLVMA